MAVQLRQMMRALHPVAPSQNSLRKILERSFALFPETQCTEKAKDLIRTSFVLSYEGHKNAPNRASGEIYFMHVFRQYVHACLLMHKFGVFSYIILCVILLHDTVEDAKKGGSTPFIAKSQIVKLIGKVIAYLVMWLTKKKDTESRDEFLERVIRCDRVEALIAKPFDGYDNIFTLAATKKETQMQKVEEIFRHYPLMLERTLHLLETEGGEGGMPDWRKWQKLVQALHRTLMKQAIKEKERVLQENLTPAQ